MLSELEDSDPKKIGGFTLVGRLGEGGMGTIYLATHRSIGNVALKALRKDHCDNASMRKRFKREVDAFSSVAITGVPRVIAENTSASQPFFAMELVSGHNLLTLVQTGGPLSDERIVHTGRELSRIVAELHHAGVIHGDINPSNIILTKDGPYLIDFGIATCRGKESSVDGTEFGSPDWLAPELRAGGRRTSAVDVFGWATTMCFATSGKLGDDGSWNFVPAVEDDDECPGLWTLPEAIRDVTCAALAHDPLARPSAEDVQRIIHDQADRDYSETVDAYLGMHAETQPVGQTGKKLFSSTYRPRTITPTDNTIVKHVASKSRRTKMIALCSVPAAIVLTIIAFESGLFGDSSQHFDDFKQSLPEVQLRTASTVPTTSTTSTTSTTAPLNNAQYVVPLPDGTERPATPEEIQQELLRQRNRW